MFDVDDYTCEASNRGKLRTEPFSRNEFLNKRRARPGDKQLLMACAWVDFFLGEGWSNALEWLEDLLLERIFFD